MPVGVRETTYERWIRDEERLPVVRGHGVTDVNALELGPWARLGGRGAYIQLQGMEGLTGMYVGEIPPGGALEPERHMYDELIYILSGRGLTEVWNPGDDTRKNLFEWSTGSLFAPPLNTWHRFLNGSGTEPVRFLGVTTAPLVMDLYHNVHFVLNCDYVFDDRYDGKPDYFNVGERYLLDAGKWLTWMWETNFIPDVRGTALEAQTTKGTGMAATVYQMAGNVLVGHLAEWPVGRYQKAHFHGGGAILLIVRSRGYTLMWPREAGTQPYQNGYGDQVVKVDWQPGSVFSPPTGWFHQHFNAGPEPARQVALRYGSRMYGVQFWDIQAGEGVLVDVKQGGAMIQYEDEDPEIRRQFERALAEAGVSAGTG
jgi:mannose-6-phosphate isomerase-like protein (cupin superfamily)